jgi:hypothetical protein
VPTPTVRGMTLWSLINRTRTRVGSEALRTDSISDLAIQSVEARRSTGRFSGSRTGTRTSSGYQTRTSSQSCQTTGGRLRLAKPFREAIYQKRRSHAPEESEDLIARNQPHNGRHSVEHYCTVPKSPIPSHVRSSALDPVHSVHFRRRDRCALAAVDLAQRPAGLHESLSRLRRPYRIVQPAALWQPLSCRSKRRPLGEGHLRDRGSSLANPHVVAPGAFDDRGCRNASPTHAKPTALGARRIRGIFCHRWRALAQMHLRLVLTRCGTGSFGVSRRARMSDGVSHLCHTANCEIPGQG